MSPQSEPRAMIRLELLREQRYRQRFLSEDTRQTSIVIILMVAAISVTVRNDLLLLRGTWMLGPLLALRALHAATAAAIVALLRRARRPRQQDRLFAVWNVATSALFAAVLLSRLPSGEVQGPFFGTSIMLCGVFFAQRGRLAQRVFSAVAIGASMLVLLWNPAGQSSPAGRATGTVALLFLCTAGTLTARSFEEQRRKRFRAERHELMTRRQLARKMLELSEEKERTEAMSRARTAFLAAMSHEFRTPMNAVIGLSDLLLDARLDAESRDRVRTIGQSARALLGLLNNILDFAKIDAGKLDLAAAPFDVRALAASVTDMMRPMAQARSVALSAVVSPGLPELVEGDEARLRQILVNLVSNAIKFTERGSVTLRIAAREDGDGEPWITFRVEDTGIGMAPDVLARLFNAFEQADAGISRRYGGTGLGLAICKQIVMTMGGEIRAESEPGQGSVFSFDVRLPVASSPVPSRAGGPASQERPAAPLRILLVDDHPINQMVARALLTRRGHAVDTASDGPGAVEAVLRARYDLVLMDLQMPGMSGVEATRQIRERCVDSDAPHIFALTASVFEADRRACTEAGMEGFLGKPIDMREVEGVLARVAAERGSAAGPDTGAGARAVVEEPEPSPPPGLKQIRDIGGSELVAKVIETFVSDTEQRLRRMEDALLRGAASEIAMHAHSLRSSSATVGASEISARCAEIEDAARGGLLAGLDAQLRAISSDLAQVARSAAARPQNGVQ